MKINYDEVKQKIEESGWQLLSKTYTNLNTELEMVCDEGHKVYLPWKKGREKLICPVCEQNKFKTLKTQVMPKKKGSYRVLGLDQATRITGFSIYEDKQLIHYGLFKTSNSEEVVRDHEIKEWLISMVNSWEIDYVGIEGIQYQEKINGGVTTFETLARLQGILMETLYSMGIGFRICPSSTWRAHCGVKGKTRNDKKTSMQFLVKQWYDVNVSDDCADAIGIGKFVAEARKPIPVIENWE